MHDTAASTPLSWYAATAQGAQSYESFADTSPQRWDLVIVGAGLTGLSAALAGAQSGQRVCVLEAERVMGGASGRNGGQLLTGWRLDLQALADKLGLEHAQSLFSLAETCKAYVKTKAIMMGARCGFVVGSADVAEKPRHVPQLLAQARATETIGSYPHLRYADAAEVRDLFGCDRFYGAIIDTGAGHLHPLNYGLGLAAQAQQAGACIFEHSPVTALKAQGRQVQVTVGDQTLSAERVLIATDGYLRAHARGLNPELERKTFAISSAIVATKPLCAAVVARINAKNYCVSGSKRIATYFRMTADHRLLFGASESVFAHKYRNTQVIGARVRPYLRALYPELATVDIQYAWSGQVGLTRSRIPEVQVDPTGRIWSIGGFSGMGVALSALGATLLVPAMRGVNLSLLKAVQSVTNLNVPRAPWLRLPLLSLGVLWYRCCDRLL